MEWVQAELGELVGCDPLQLEAVVRSVRQRLWSGRPSVALDGGHEEVRGWTVVVPAGPEQAVHLGNERGFLVQFAQCGFGRRLARFDAAAG